MISDQPSLTALISAAARAAHPIVDAEPYLFVDPLAERLLGDRAEELLSYQRTQGQHPILMNARAVATCRSRYTETLLAAALGHGVDQYVILAAGLDSYAYRADRSGAVRVFEVDHPGTQNWKRARLAEAGMALPEWLRLVPVDFETDPLADRLRSAGYDPTRPAFVSWLGVTMYLTAAAIAETLAVLSGFGSDTELVLDYLLPDELLDPADREHSRAVGAAVAGQGEPWRSTLAPERVHELLTAAGLVRLADVSHRDALDPALWRRTDGLRPSGQHRLAHARRP